VIGFVTIKPIIGQVMPDSIASKAGVQANTEIISVDFEKISGWTGFMFRLLAHVGDNDKMTIGTRAPNKTEKMLHVLDLADWKMDGLSPDPLSSLGIMPYDPPVPLLIGFISDNSPAAHSPLKVGDKIIAIDGKHIRDWPDLMKTIQSHANQETTFTVQRAKKTMKLPVAIGSERPWLFKKSGYLGISPDVEFPPEMLRKVQHSPLAAIPHALHEVSEFTYFNLVLFAKLFAGKLSLQTLGGPITIFESAGKALNYGITPFIAFLAFLSASVGAINLIPIPGLDGGHLLFETIEFIIRRPIPQRLLIGLYYMGFAFIMFVLIQALMNDVLRLV
jgi:regulator of sigma E protease